VKPEPEQIEIPHRAPVMVLPNATLFPHTLLPLFIFEPRYRDMLAWSLEHHRMFCIALMKPGLEDAKTPDEFHHIGSIGFIRACVGHDDGTSHLILQGLARVEMTGFEQDRPFRMASLSPMNSEPPGLEESEILSAQILEYCAHFRAKGVNIPERLDEQLANVSDPATLCDIVTHTFVRDPHRRQLVLEQIRVAERMKMLIRHLGEENA